MEAPLVSLEEEFEEGPGDDGGTPQRSADPALAELESFSAEMMSFKSMEDLVQEFDEKLTVCFRNYDAATEGLAPVRGRLQAQEEEERLQDEEMCGVPGAGVGAGCVGCPVQMPGAGRTQVQMEDTDALQVIEELEELMQSSPDPEADPEGSGGGTEPIVLRELHAFSPAFNNNCSHEGMASKAQASRALSAELVAQLARRDELAFEKEVKTAFIGALLAVQGEQREQREAARRRRRDKGLSMQGARSERGSQMPRKRFSMEGISSILHSGLRQTFGPTTNEKQYLNTVIPYEKKGSPPSVEDLQMLTNSEYSFNMNEFRAASDVWGTQRHILLCCNGCTLGYHCSTASLGDFFCLTAAWAV
uniref:FEZ1 protein n=1 Tax=Malurus cyaneus samueli TaxID=2593467 RepID=A0A8C5TH99_9PASS